MALDVYNLFDHLGQSWKFQLTGAVLGAVGAAAFMPTPALIFGIGVFMIVLGFIWSLPVPSLARLSREIWNLTSARHYLGVWGLGLVGGAILVWVFSLVEAAR
jgi:hypothetical protein